VKSDTFCLRFDNRYQKIYHSQFMELFIMCNLLEMLALCTGLVLVWTVTVRILLSAAVWWFQCHQGTCVGFLISQLSLSHLECINYNVICIHYLYL